VVCLPRCLRPLRLRGRGVKGWNVLKIRISFLAVAFLLLVGCAAPTKMSQSNANAVGTKLTYFKDGRTDQCFAAIENLDTGQFTNGFTVTWVPCDAKVIALIP